MVNTLFIWSKENEEISYKQGMNELLGLLLFVRYCERTTDEHHALPFYEYFHALYGEEYIQPDLYFTFKAIMDHGIKELFNPVVMRMDKRPKDDSLFAWKP